MNPPVLYGVYAVAAVLLVAGGLMKAVKPRDTANALVAAGLPVTPALVRLGGAAEGIVAGLAIVLGGRPLSAAIVASYAAFTAFVVIALRKHTPIASCGCFGEADASPTVLHAVITAVACITSVMMTVQGPPSLESVLASQPWAGLPLVLAVGTAGYVAFLAMAVLPRTMQAVRGQS